MEGAVCRRRGMWELQCVGVAVCGSCGMWELQCVGVAVCVLLLLSIFSRMLATL